MIMARPMLASLIALALAAPLAAQEQNRMRTFEGPNVSATGTTTVDPEAGTAIRDRAVTNVNTGNTGTSSAVRQRTGSGATLSVVQTGPQGNSRSFTGERTRTENGSTFNGTATGRSGETFGIAGRRSRDGQGNAQASQTLTNARGEVLGSRDRTTTRSNGQVNRNVARSRPEGAARPVRGRRPRG